MKDKGTEGGRIASQVHEGPQVRMAATEVW